ncbi:MAG: extracellular solute-binding protein [Oscillospiraceae bacterium]|nr:extracellular solute-binding protein [Oscillospiraceae bacterium]
MKKLLAIVLALVTVLSLCACVKTGAYTDEDNKGFLTAEGKTKLTIGVRADAMIMDLDNNALTKWVEETCNVDIEFMEFAGGTDVPTQISTAIAARQELPDIVIGVELGDKVLNRYGKDGYIIDLQDYFADKEGASKVFWDRITTELTEDQQRLVITKIQDPVTEAIYTVPCVETSLIDKLDSLAWINVEWLDKLGLEKPTNTEELKTVLKAFKTKDPNGNGMADEIPLYGTNSGMCSNVVSWLMNMCTYWNHNRIWMADENNKIYVPYTTDGYREGLSLVNELYEEGLLTNMLFSGLEKSITTPTNGTALCGIFLGHLTVHIQNNNPVIDQYEPLKTWGYATRADMSVSKSTWITENCAEGKRDKAFEVLMTLWSWEGSMRQRYGEFGVNWDMPDEGAKSDMDLPATYKLYSDPIKMQNTCRWPSMCALNVYAECETAQLTAESDSFYAKRIKLHADAYKLFEEAEKSNPTELIARPFTTTAEEQEKVAMERTNVDDYRSKCMTDFITGKLDINDDKVWKTYIDTLYEHGLQAVLDYAQDAYDRTARFD